MPDFDRRHPAVRSDELRRQLRERDQECYYLRSEMDRTAPAPAPQVAVMARTPPLLLAAISAVAVLGISGGAVLWNHCSNDAPLADRQVSLGYRIVSAPIINDALAYSASSAYSASIDVPAEPAPAAIARALPPVLHRQLIRHASDRRVTTPRVVRRTVEHRPRPLSPGEFGRSRPSSSKTD